MPLGTQRRDRLRKLAHRVRSIPGRGFGIRNYTVAIVVGTWSGAYVGRGDKTEALEAITEAHGQPPKVRFLNEEQLALAELKTGACEIGPITPNFPGGGTALSDLLPAVTAHKTVHVRLTGPAYPSGAKFLVKKVGTDRALHWTLTCEPVEGA